MFSTPAGARAGIFITPDDFLTNPQKCPLIVFSHGVGEAGDGTLATVNLLYNNGSPLAVAKAGLLNAVIAPKSKAAYRFAVLGLQGTRGWCVQASDQVAVILQLIKDNLQLSGKVFKTGLSAGGQVTWEALLGPNSFDFDAGWPMSTPQINAAIVNYKNVVCPIWARHGNTDTGGLTDIQNSIHNVDFTNGADHGAAMLTTYNGSHCCWAKEYDPATRYPINGVSMNGYEFFLNCIEDGNFLFTASGTPAGVNGTTPITPMTTKAIPVINIAGGIGTLNSNTSTLNGGFVVNSSFNWVVTPAVSFAGGINYGGGASGTFPDIKASVFLPNTKYTFILKVNDQFGGSNTDSIDITTDASGNASSGGANPPPVVTVVKEFDVITTAHVQELSDNTNKVTSSVTVIK
jgi:dienelactone hydrolase